MKKSARLFLGGLLIRQCVMEWKEREKSALFER